MINDDEPTCARREGAMTITTTNYHIEQRAECAHCGGNGRCYPCDGRGWAGDGNDAPEECEECLGTGGCESCVDGREHWLIYESEGKTRGSCLTRTEVADYLQDGTRPAWWKSYHGVE